MRKRNGTSWIWSVYSRRKAMMVAEMEDDGTTTEDDTPREREMNAKTKA